MSRTGAIGRKREQQIKDIDRARLVEMMRTGYTQQEIADKLGIAVSMVCYEWKVVIKQRREQMSADTEELVALKMEEYAELKRQAWEAWKRSCEPAEEEYMESSEGDRGNKTTEGRKRKGQTGNPAYLRTVVECLAAERELQALNPVKEVRGTFFMANWGDVLNAMPKDGNPTNEVTALIEQALNGVNGEAPKQIEATEVKDSDSNGG